jgi:glycosyltransferase involved in cell wall biosynthesis
MVEIEVITTENNRAALEKEDAERPLGFQVHYLGEKKTWHPNRMLARAQSWLETLNFSRQILAKAQKIHAEQPFDLVHHVTISTWRVASPLWRLGIPFVWGPIGGGEAFPWECRSLLSPQAQIFEAARELSNIASRLSPRIRATAQNAAFCLAANEDTKKLLLALRGQKSGVEVMSPAMFLPERIKSLQAGVLLKPEVKPLRIFAGGNLEGRKGVAIALQALAIAKNQGVDFVFRLGGYGPERMHLQNLAKELGIEDRVTFGDSLSGDDYLNELRKSHLYLLPSLREHTGLTLLEAMLAGCVPIVANGGGPGSIVSGNRGFKIAVSDPGKMAAEIVEVICLLARDPGLRGKLGVEASRFAATEYSVKNYQNRMAEIYRKAIALKN